MEKKLYDTLFLDRDGVINRRTPGVYFQKWEDFIFEKNALEAIVLASKYFERILVVTNQSGLEKRSITEEGLLEIHFRLMEEVAKNGGKIDKIYFCPHKAFSRCGCRKPALGMGNQAKADFPDLDFLQSIMVGDSISDIEFGKSLGMKTVLVEGKHEEYEAQRQLSVDFRVKNLMDFVAQL
jgi:D-glycero-D-manno-heptose 1,7-bisphosphate phosphatase